MSWLEAVILGLVQGLAEFLPISSSGHLALGQELLGVATEDVTFVVIVHFGTLLAVVTEFRGRIWELTSGFVTGDAQARRMTAYLIVGTLPAGLVGLFLENAIGSLFNSPLAVCGFLILTGIILFSTRFRKGERTEIGLVDALLIGVAQAGAILPGISRSGMTISAGLWKGIDGEEAARFSFLLSCPVIAGATILKVKDLVESGVTADHAFSLVVGAGVAYVSGIVAIRWLMAVVARGGLPRFAYYCWTIGLAGLLLFRG